MKTVWFAIGAVVFLAGLFPGLARAESERDRAEAKTYFDAGAQAYERGQFEAALLAFERSYALAPRPGTLFSTAQTERRQFVVDRDKRRLVHAAALYREYLRLVSEGGRRSEAADALVELEPMLVGAEEGSSQPDSPVTRPSRLMVTSGTIGAQVSIDAGEPQPAPFIGVLPEGDHQITVSAEGYVATKRAVSLERGAILALDLSLEPSPAFVAVRAPDGTHVYVDGKLLGITPLSPFEVRPGPHTVVTSRHGTTASATRIDARAGSTLQVESELAPSGQRIAAWVVLSASLASLSVGGIFLGLTISEQSNAQELVALRETRGLTASEASDYNDALERREVWRAASTATLLASGVGGALSGLLFGLDAPDPGDAQPQPSVAVGAGSVVVTVSF